MRPISTEGFEKPKASAIGAVPMLQWLRISDLIVDPAYQRPIVGKGRKNVDRIARAFNWACFAPVVVSPIEGGKFAIIDGQHRTTAAALLGIDTVPCQVVIAAREEQAAAFKAINGVVTPISRMALHAAALVAGEAWAITLAEVCKRADVELLRYPVPLNKQFPGQTMAVGAIANCLKQYGERTLVTALRCVTQTSNNKPGMLNAPLIKAICEVLNEDAALKERGSAFIDAFDKLDLVQIQQASSLEAAAKRISRAAAIANEIRNQLSLDLTPRKAA